MENVQRPASVDLPEGVLHEILVHPGISTKTLKTVRNVNRYWNAVSCRVLNSGSGLININTPRQINYFLSEFPNPSEVLQVTRFKVDITRLGFQEIKAFFQHLGGCTLAKLCLDGGACLRFPINPQASKDLGEKLVFCLNEVSNVRHLRLTLYEPDVPLSQCQFHFQKLFRFEFEFLTHNTDVSEEALIIKIILASPNLKELKVKLNTPSFCFESTDNQQPPNVQSSLRNLPGLISKLPKNTKVFLSIKLQYGYGWYPWDNSRKQRFMVWKQFFEGLMNQLRQIPWTAFEIAVDPEFTTESGSLVAKHAATLRCLRTGLDPSWTEVGALPFQNCRVLEIMISEVTPSETLYQLFPNVQQFVLNGKGSMIPLLETVASKLPKLSHLVLRQATWKSLTTTRPKKSVSEVSAIASSKETVRLSSPVLSNPLGKIQTLKTLVVGSSCDRSAFDWILYISALGELKRLKMKILAPAVGGLRGYTELIFRFHDRG